MKWCVWFVKPEVHEKWFFERVRFFDKLNGVVCILKPWHLLSRAVVGSVGVKAVLVGCGRVGNHIVAEVPFSKMAGEVSGFLKELGKECGVWI